MYNIKNLEEIISVIKDIPELKLLNKKLSECLDIIDRNNIKIKIIETDDNQVGCHISNNSTEITSFKFKISKGVNYLKETKIYVLNDKESIEFQNKVFDLGVEWKNGHNKVKLTDCRYYFIDKDLKLSISDNLYYFLNSEFDIIKIYDVLNLLKL